MLKSEVKEGGRLYTKSVACSVASVGMVVLTLDTFFFFRFLYRLSSALMCRSSTDVLFWTDWGTFCAGGHPNVHFS